MWNRLASGSRRLDPASSSGRRSDRRADRRRGPRHSIRRIRATTGTSSTRSLARGRDDMHRRSADPGLTLPYPRRRGRERRTVAEHCGDR
jgi:hypothetical protein